MSKSISTSKQDPHILAVRAGHLTSSSRTDRIKDVDPQDEEYKLGNELEKKRKLDFSSEDVDQTAQELLALRTDRDEKANENAMLRARIMELENSLGTSEASLQDSEEVKSKLVETERLLQVRTEEVAETSAANAQMEDQIDKLQKSLEERGKAVDTQLIVIAQLSSRLKLDQKASELTNLKVLSQTECDLKAENTRLKLQLQKMEKSMKDIRDRLMLSQGNIRVFCRVRPLSAKEGKMNLDAMAVLIPKNNIDNKIAVKGHEGDFKFDKVFSPDTTQTLIFKEIADLVISALDGYKTGSGKTFTMFGDSTDETLRGVIPRSMQQIFQAIREKASTGWNYTVQASLLEIHNEAIRDLLKGYNDDDEATSSKPEKGSAAAKKAELSLYNIIHEKDGSTTVLGLRVVTVQSVEDAAAVFAYAHKKRAVGRTDMNEESSRSHAVFTLRLNGRNKDTGETTHGILNLIDLAGSERLKRSNATGATRTESININKSLSCLSHVLEARAKGELPRYRDGKLTYLLQKSIEKQSRTVMFLNISPDSSSTDETLGSLKFGTMVNGCDIGVASRDIRSGDSGPEDLPTRTGSSSIHHGSKMKGKI
ncbi:unnamed protein product [Closterium sp. NIES-64]|nr:unnamed protein product [Closterium sp. NIES-64]